MRAGATQIDITPPTPKELSGFVAREQPSTGIHDFLYAKALFLDDEVGGKLLWIHADVIGFDAEFCDLVRRQLAAHAKLSEDQVIVSATHTHSGPPTLRLNNCGAWRAEDAAYRKTLQASMIEAGLRAMKLSQPARLTFGQSLCDVNRDRRGLASAHVDHRCSTVGVLRMDGTYLAILANYPCHPVALGPENRKISGDLFGFAAKRVSSALGGTAVVLFTNGACGNLNPPRVGDDFAACEQVGFKLGDSALEALGEAIPLEGQIHSLGERFEVDAEWLTSESILARAESIRLKIRAWDNGWVDRALDSVQQWEDWMMDSYSPDMKFDLRLHALSIGSLRIACIGAETFSILGDILRTESGEPLFIVGYTNGEIGYLCPIEAHEEGGYEVETAFVYYNSPPVKVGEFERASKRLAGLLTPTASNAVFS